MRRGIEKPWIAASLLLFLVVACGAPQAPTPAVEPLTATPSASVVAAPAEAVDEDERLVVAFVDVGQGDGAVIVSPDGRVVVIDAGTRGGGEQVVSWLRERGIRRVDLAVMSHAHNDHMGGFLELLDHFEVLRFLDPGFPHTSGVYARLLERLEDEQVPVFVGQRGRRIQVDDDVTIEVLHPWEPFLASTRSDVNSNSIVLLVRHGENTLLFTGDAEEPTEARLIDEGLLTDVDLLKVAHHGSEHSSSERFLALTLPEIAVISAGANNSYGHPDEETLSRLAERRRVRILRTDVEGTIVIESDGERLFVRESDPTGAGDDVRTSADLSQDR